MEVAGDEAQKRQEFEVRRKLALEEQARQTESEAKAVARLKLRNKTLLWSAIGAWLVLGGLAGIGIGIGERWGWGIVIGPLIGWVATAAMFGFYFMAVHWLDRLLFRSKSSAVTVLSLYWLVGPAILIALFYFVYVRPNLSAG